MTNTQTIILLLLLPLYSFSEIVETINPFKDPSVIWRNRSKQEPYILIDSQSVEVSTKIINPFKDPSIIFKDSSRQEEAYTEPITFQPSNKREESSNKIDLYSIPEPVVDNYPKKDTPSYLRATNQDVLDAKALPKSPNENIYSNSPAPDIQGEYQLVNGTRDYGGALKTVRDAYLVIEKLDDKNFGYYYTYTLDKTTPYTRYGIFNYHKNRFNQRVIDDEKFKTSNMDNVEITQNGNNLKMIFDVNGGALNAVWRLDMMGTDSLPLKIKKSLESAKKDYIDIYKNRFPNFTY